MVLQCIMMSTISLVGVYLCITGCVVKLFDRIKLSFLPIYALYYYAVLPVRRVMYSWKPVLAVMAHAIELRPWLNVG